MRLALISLFLVSALSAQTPMTLHERGEGPSRNFHVVHYKIDIRLDEIAKSVAGTMTATIVPYYSGVSSIRLQAGKMSIASVTMGKSPLTFTYDSSALAINLGKGYGPSDTLLIAVAYSCRPDEGMTWASPDSAYPKRRWQIWSQGEDTTNHFWFPCYDFPNEKSTSEVIVTVNGRFTALSNGKLVSTKENRKEGTKTFHWVESKPHASYLIMVAAGEFAILHDHVGRLPLDFYVYPDDTANARVNFSKTADMIRFFNDKIGIPYAWEKYAQIILQDHFGGMENTSATTLSDLATVYDARMRLDDSPTSLIAHELAHQWWGDLVTCRDFRHMWLNESFASYFDPLYHEHALGEDEFSLTMYNDQEAGVVNDTARGRKPIVVDGTDFTNIYPRGAAVLNMLRFVLGDEMFWRAIHHYLATYQYTSVETNDFKRAVEEATGQNLYWFFDEWVYKAGHPVFDVSQRWSDSAKTLYLTVRQTQALDSLTGLFRMPVDIGVTTSSGTTTTRVGILAADSTYAIPCASAPALVIFDEGNKLIKELKFAHTPAEWAWQAANAPGLVDRIRAIKQVAALPDAEQYVSVFCDAMRHDPFWAVRLNAINQGGKVKFSVDTFKDRFRESLIAAARDAKSAVRDAAVAQLRNYTGPDVAAALQAALKDSSYNVMASALRSLAKADSAHALPVLKEYLSYPSARNRVANAALGSIAAVDTEAAVAEAMTKVRYGQDVGARFTALGILGKYAKGRPAVRDILTGILAERPTFVRSTAIRMLGDFGNAATIAPLERVASEGGSTAESAKRSIEKIRKSLGGK